MTGNIKQVSRATEVDERAAALVANSQAITALASAVEGTIGPKGLDCMLVDRFGDVTVTNDGATILDKIDTAHPAARMLIKAAQAQEEAIGDGTTTTTLLASALISEGAAHVTRGVPVAKVIEGMRGGVERALEYIETSAREIADLGDPALLQTALIAARGHRDIAELIVEAARLTGLDTLRDPGFSLADAVLAQEGAPNEVFAGIVIDKQRVNRQMPREIRATPVLVVDDAIEPVKVEDDALGTDAGFAKHLAFQEEFAANVRKVIDLGVRFVAAAKAVDPIAEELLTDAGVLAVRRLSSRDIARLVELTGARTVKRAGLARDPAELRCFLGHCDRAYEDEKLDHIRVVGGADGKVATVLVGASTREVKDERERIARDAAGAVQAAIRSGVVPGGGAIEIAAARHVSATREGVRGMAAYGIDSVASALKKPMSQIVANAGFNPLEKVEDAIAAQSESGNTGLAVDCDSGEIADMTARGIVDPAAVKLYALRSAFEIAEAILRINTIIRKRDESASAHTAPETG